jgi:hypothetical protein
VNQNIDGSTEQGIAQCRRDPLSCGIDIDPNLNNVIKETIAQCQNNPTFCGIDLTQCPTPNQTKIIRGFFSLSDGSLHLPAIDVPNVFNNNVISYEVEMKIVPGREPLSFSITSAIPLEE